MSRFDPNSHNSHANSHARELLKDDPLWLYLKDRLAEPVALEPTVVRDKPRRP